jgi:dGTPase
VTPSLRETLEKEEDRRLAPWGIRTSRTRGRLFAEAEHPYRTAFQRDRDRIIHSTAFRRLQYKTQVFVYHEGDHFRNRLTHTLEVAQIARTVARALGANEDLTEAIVLAHDLGHTPFGHAGERVLHRLMRKHGGFEHNRQSLRIVDFLEIRSEGHRGLNLTHETREGILKHGVPSAGPEHPVPWPETGRCASLEAQIADTADEVAYHNHDIDDGLRSGLLSSEQLTELKLWRRAVERTLEVGGSEIRVARRQAIRALIDLLVTDLVETTRGRLEEERIGSPDEVRGGESPVVAFSNAMDEARRELGAFLRENLYHHSRVVRMSAKAERILSDLWKAYEQDERLLPRHVRDQGEEGSRERVIADYIAGMTDRFAMEEHRRLFDPTAHV